LRQLVKACPKEDEYLDYKAGKTLADPKAAAATVRQYASAFGNGEGGALVIGYDQAAQTFDGATVPGGALLAEWAANVLSQQGPFFAPPPRIAPATVNKRTVLAIAFPRAPGLVPVVEAGAISHYVRIGDTNVRMPDHLVADLVLGRRRRPVLRVGVYSVRLDPAAAVQLAPGDVRGHLLRATFVVENISLVPADDVRLGLAVWSVSGGIQTASRVLPGSLRASLTVNRPQAYQPSTSPVGWLERLVPGGREHESPTKPRIDKLNLGAFDLSPNEALWPFAVPLFPNHIAAGPLDPRPDVRNQLRGFVRLRAGLFVIARDSVPQWYQLTFDYGRHSSGGIASQADLSPALDGRPVVSAEFLAEDLREPVPLQQDWP
jgi:hypothetical protein